jgi:phosphatidylserine/phosphatidylglycerophosphate/cardiolipin synthase-like enzyme
MLELMHRIAIFLRQSVAVSKFRRAILNTLRTDLIDEALVCSGFFQGDAKYSTGTDFDLISHRTGGALKITTLGLYSYRWSTQYASFFSQLKARNSASCFTAVQKRIPSMGWHAKVFLAKSAGKPLVAIIGSSNITRRAFGELKDFNYECDVVMWDECVSEIDKAIEAAIGDGADIPDVIVSRYDDSHRANSKSLEDRLLALEKEVLSKAIDV